MNKTKGGGDGPFDLQAYCVLEQNLCLELAGSEIIRPFVTLTPTVTNTVWRVLILWRLL